MRKRLQEQIERARRYRAAPGAGYNDAEAEVIGRELEDMTNRGIQVTPESVVERAKDEANPLHKHFEWNDGIAAVNWRKHEARQLVNHLLIIVETPGGGEQPVKAAFSVTVPAATMIEAAGEMPEREYVSICAVQSIPAYREQVFRQAVQELQSWRSKFEPLGFEELRHVFAAARTVAPKD